MQLEVYGAPIYLPIAETGRVGATATADLGRQIFWTSCLAARFSLVQRALRGGRSRFWEWGGSLASVGLIAVRHGILNSKRRNTILRASMFPAKTCQGRKG
jgi:hypothetical protein